MKDVIETAREKLGGARTQSVRAVWNDAVLAESERTTIVEGNHYFPPDDVNWELFEPSGKRTTCPWKGEADYLDVIVDGDRPAAAAWRYQTPSKAAKQIKDHIAFWGGVRVETL